MKKTFIIYDDNNIRLESLKYILKENYAHHKILAVNDTNSINSSLDPNSVFILNISSLKSSEVFAIIEHVKNNQPTIPILTISNLTTVDFVKKMYNLGIDAYLDASCNLDDFLIAIGKVMEGEKYINDQVRNLIYKDIFDPEFSISKPKSDELTKRESEILSLICNGLITKEIADQLFISIHTVETHKRNIMQKFGVHNCTSLMKYVLENKILSI